MFDQSANFAMPSHDAPAAASTHLVVAGVAVLVACAMPILIQFGAAQSAYVRVDGHWSDYAMGLIWAALIAVTIAFWPVRHSMKVPLLWAWLLRAFVALFVSLPFFYHYSSLDLYLYFGERTTLPDLSQLGFEYGTQNIIALVWMVNRLIPDSFHAMNVTFAVFSLIGVYCFWMASEQFLGFSSRPVFYLLMLEPSLTFWTASLGKESVVTFAVGLYTYAVVAWWRTRRSRHLLQAAAGVVIASLIRTWMAGIMIGPLIVLIYALQRGIVRRIVTTIVIAAAVNAALPFILESFYLQAAQDLTEQVASISGRFNLGDSAGAAFALNGPLDLARYAPLGMFSALFRPLPGDVRNAFGVLAGIEDVVLLGLFALAVKRCRLRDFKDPLVFWALAVIFLWALVYAFVSSQNFGTAVRYRVQILPIFLGLLLYFGRNRRPALLATRSSTRDV
jgi:hypothetical protein